MTWWNIYNLRNHLKENHGKMYIKDLMINPIISLPVASFIVLSYQPLRTKNGTTLYKTASIFAMILVWNFVYRIRFMVFRSMVHTKSIFWDILQKIFYKSTHQVYMKTFVKSVQDFFDIHENYSLTIFWSILTWHFL